MLEKNNILTEFKGALTEQYVAQQLKISHEIYYWAASNASAKVDFLIQFQQAIIPIEVKAEENLKSKSLKVFVEKYALARCVRTSMSRFHDQDWLVNVPLYGIGAFLGKMGVIFRFETPSDTQNRYRYIICLCVLLLFQENDPGAHHKAPKTPVYQCQIQIFYRPLSPIPIKSCSHHQNRNKSSQTYNIN